MSTRFGSPQIFWLQPHSCSLGSALLLGRGMSLKHQTKTEALTWKKPQILIALMTSCRFHPRSISDWIFSLASWCLWPITPRWNYTGMYRIECEIKWILCFTRNYSMAFPPCLAVRLAMWESTEPQSWEYNGISTSWNPDLYFLLQLIQSTGDLGHGKCFLWGWKSPFPKLEKMPHSFDPHMLRIDETDQTTYFKIWHDSLSGCSAEFGFSHLFNPEQRMEATPRVRKLLSAGGTLG